jgi:uncharacterized protein DUF4124
MIWTTVGKIVALAGLSLLIESSIASAQIFQWTDVKGIIHFTDNPYSIPESIRNSSALIVRKDMDTNSHSSSVTSFEPLPAVEISSATNPSDPIATAVVTYAPQEVIVVVNSNLRQPNNHPCKLEAIANPPFVQTSRTGDIFTRACLTAAHIDTSAVS